MGYFDGMSLKDMSNMDGVKDLPMAVRAKFIKALREEDKGNHDEAALALNEAVAIEAANLANVK